MTDQTMKEDNITMNLLGTLDLRVKEILAIGTVLGCGGDQ